jgi:hypothetical protein
VRRGQEGRNAGVPQPRSDFRGNGRLQRRAGSVQQNNARVGKTTKTGRDRLQMDTMFPPTATRSAGRAAAQGQQGNGAPREMETRGGQNRSNREVEPAVAHPGKAG